MRELVQLPMNTGSTATSRIGVPALRPMYSSARAALRAVGSAKSSGEGIAPASGTTCAGFVPQVTCGLDLGGVEVLLLSKVASGSVGSVRQSSSASSHASPFGA